LTDIKVSDVPLSAFNVKKWRDGNFQIVQDFLAEETPIAIIYNGISHAVMLATPQNLEDFALGFSLSEGILQNVSELYGIEIQVQDNGIELHCEIATERIVQLKERRRTLAGKTGCGLCGAENLAQAMHYPVPLITKQTFDATAIANGVNAIQTQQKLQQQTGATHASAYVQGDGEVSLVREDVGRHNALDKLVGALAKQAIDKTGFIITTSRASFEMVQKTASAGIAMLVAVSAPTGLAVRVAEHCNLTLVGFARDNRYVVYSHAENIVNR
jgi:FdhD protein